MTLTILVSFSLLALVVTARPIVPNAGSESIQSLADVQNAVQAIFQQRTGRSSECLDCTEEEDIRVHLTSSEEQDDYLSQLDGLDAVKAILPLGIDGVLTDDEAKLYSLLNDNPTGGRLDDLEGGERPVQDEEMIPPTGADSSPSESNIVNDTATIDLTPTAPTSPPLLILAVSCIAALLALGCITTVLYVAQSFSRRVLTSELAWDVLPKVEKHTLRGADDGDDGSGSSKERKLLGFNGALRRGESESPLGNMEKMDEKECPKEATSSESTSQDGDGEDEHNGHYLDAPDDVLLFVDSDTVSMAKHRNSPRIIVEEHPDPELLPLLPALQMPTPFATPIRTPLAIPQPSPIRRPLQMREPSSSTSSPASKPAWSLRASDSPSFVVSPLTIPLPFSRSASPKIPGALPLDPRTDEHYASDTDTDTYAVERPERGRAYRAPIPELDIAFALQLRPGLGLGADPAWLVRFLMAMFGWMTVLWGGGVQRERQQRVTL